MAEKSSHAIISIRHNHQSEGRELNEHKTDVKGSLKSVLGDTT